MEKSRTANRMSGLDLLRCLAMMMVVVLHFLGKGKLLPDLTNEALGSTGAVAWLLEAFCIVAVNTYMFISGYFLCTSSFKLSRLLQLWLQIWVFSVGFGLLGAWTGIVQETPVDIHYYLTLLFPISMGHYWFMSAYVYLYLLLPMVCVAVKQMNKKQMQWAIGMLLFAYSVIKSVLPLRMELDAQGYDVVWYLCVFLVAAYIRNYGMPILEKKSRGLLLYVISAVLIFVGLLGLRFIYLQTGSFQRMLKMTLEYNHLLPLLSSLGLFMVFKNIRVSEKVAGIVKRLGGYSLGVYLLHENIGLRYTWQNWLGADKVSSVGGLLLSTVVAVVAVFVCGILVDVIRKGIFDALHGALKKLTPYRKLMGAIGQVDALFASKEKYEQEQ